MSSEGGMHEQTALAPVLYSVTDGQVRPMPILSDGIPARVTDSSPTDLATQVFARLMDEPKLTCACAESCSGGLVAHGITLNAGASEVFLGGVVSYSNEAKIGILGVPEEIIASVGAVSEECARAMAEGTRRVFGSDLAVSTTGIAGPSGGTARKPVGLVHFAVTSELGTRAVQRTFPGDRQAVIDAAARMAYSLLLDEIPAVRSAKSAATAPGDPN